MRLATLSNGVRHTPSEPDEKPDGKHVAFVGSIDTLVG
jgi:hypothetical protein